LNEPAHKVASALRRQYRLAKVLPLLEGSGPRFPRKPFAGMRLLHGGVWIVTWVGGPVS
jgi:hypothetical protein